MSLVMWISSQVNELDENLRVLSNHGKIYFICLLFFPLTESKVFKQVKKNKLCLYTFLSSHPTNYCRYSKVLLTNHVLKIHPHLNVCVCVCAISIDIFKYLFFAICVQEIQLQPIPGLQRSPGGRNGNPFQYSCLDHPKDRRAC